MFNKVKKGLKKDSEKLDKERDKKCIPLAKEYLQSILDGNLSLNGRLKEEELKNEYEPIVLKILDSYLEKEVTIIEAGYIVKLVREMIDNTNNLLVSSVNESLRIAEKKLFGMDKQDMTFSKLDEILKQ